MLSLPACCRSHEEATKFCIDKTCTKDPFICRKCTDGTCQTEHDHNGHGNINVILCERVIPRLQSLHLMNEVEQVDCSELIRVADAIILQVKDIVESYIRGMNRLRQSVSLRPQLQRVVDALRNRDSSKLKGCEMGRMVEVLNQSNPYLNKTQVFNEINLRKQHCMQLLNDLSQRLSDFNNEEKKKLRPLQERADQLKRQGMLKQAADVYSEVLRIEKSGRDFNSRGAIYFHMKDYEKALEDFTRAISLEGSNPAFHLNRGKAYENLQRYPEAIKEYSLVIELESTNAKSQLYDLRGTAYFTIEQFDKAILDYTEAIKLDPKKALFLYNRAITYYSKKEYQRAEADYSRAILLSSANAQYYLNRGVVYRDMGKLPQAIADFNKSIQLNPRVAIAYNLLGLAYLKLQKYEQAIRAFEQAIALDAFKGEYYNNRANVLYELKRFGEALEDYTRAIKIDRVNAEYFNNRGNLHRLMQNYIKALEDVNEAIKLNKNYHIFYDNRSLILEKLERYEESDRDKRMSQELRHARRK